MEAGETMTPQEFAALFPERSFAIRYVDKGPHKERKYVWHVMFTGDYWTSDSNQPIYTDYSREPFNEQYADGLGETLEEALQNAVDKVLRSAQQVRQGRQEKLLKAEQELRDLEAKLLRKP